MTAALASGTVGVYEGITVSGNIDRESRVIRDVKVIGLRSKNTGRALGLKESEFGEAVDKPYEYSFQALEEAKERYEGVRVYIDHPQLVRGGDGAALQPLSDERSLSDYFGKLVNVRVTEDGLRADLAYVSTHPLCEQVLETAERFPEHLGLSHHAFIKPVLRGERIIIESIADVRSVDLLGDRPGTTISLFESFHGGNAMPEGTAATATTENTDEQHRSTEQDEMSPAEPAPETPAEPAPEETEDSPADAVVKAFKKKAEKIVDQALNGEMEPRDAGNALRDLINSAMQAKERVAETDESADEAAESAAQEALKSTSTQASPDKTVAALERKVARMEARDKARNELAESGIQVTESAIEKVTEAILKQRDRYPIMQELRKTQATESAHRHGPRASEHTQVMERQTGDDKAPDSFVPDGASFAASVR